MYVWIRRTVSGIIYAISIIPDTNDDTESLETLTNTEPTVELLQEDDDIWLEITL